MNIMREYNDFCFGLRCKRPKKTENSLLIISEKKQEILSLLKSKKNKK